ncbi:MAG: DUF6446 family protein [Pseudomonadota bacterium]
MNGRVLMAASLAVLAVFGIALWWFQTRAFYEEFAVDAIRVGDVEVPVTDFQGIDAKTSPIKLRACMKVAPEDFDNAEPAPNATPLVAQSWFNCFNAKALSRALEAADAKAYLAAADEFDGTLRIIAVYPDGRAYMWRQLTEEFANQ